MLGTSLWWSMPRAVEALPCGSMSSTSTRRPDIASAAARFTVEVVFRRRPSGSPRSAPACASGPEGAGRAAPGADERRARPPAPAVCRRPRVGMDVGQLRRVDLHLGPPADDAMAGWRMFHGKHRASRAPTDGRPGRAPPGSTAPASRAHCPSVRSTPPVLQSSRQPPGKSSRRPVSSAGSSGRAAGCGPALGPSIGGAASPDPSSGSPRLPDGRRRARVAAASPRGSASAQHRLGVGNRQTDDDGGLLQHRLADPHDLAGDPPTPQQGACSASSSCALRPLIASISPPGTSSGAPQRTSRSSGATARAVTKGAATSPASSSARARRTCTAAQARDRPGPSQARSPVAAEARPASPRGPAGAPPRGYPASRRRRRRRRPRRRRAAGR